MKTHTRVDDSGVELETELRSLAQGDARNVRFTGDEWERLQRWDRFIKWGIEQGHYDEDNVYATPPLALPQPEPISNDADDEEIAAVTNRVGGRDFGDESALLE
jgi:hypothetical protein